MCVRACVWACVRVCMFVFARACVCVCACLRASIGVPVRVRNTMSRWGGVGGRGEERLQFHSIVNSWVWSGVCRT